MGALCVQVNGMSTDGSAEKYLKRKWDKFMSEKARQLSLYMKYARYEDVGRKYEKSISITRAAYEEFEKCALGITGDKPMWDIVGCNLTTGDRYVY